MCGRVGSGVSIGGDLLCVFIKGAGCHKCAFKGCVVLGGLNSHMGYYLVKQLVMSRW